MPLCRLIARTMLPFCCLAITLAGCASLMDTMNVAGSSQKTPPTISPPRESMQLAQVNAKIKVGDILEFRLSDDPGATINGVYPVASDGTIHLAGEAPIVVTGKKLEEARQSIRDALAIGYALQRFELTYHEYYMVRAVDDKVQKVVRVALKNGATVKDALKGAPPLANKDIWVARIDPEKPGADHVFRVDWNAITHGDKSDTNYALQSGDYLFVADRPGLQLDRILTGIVSPMGQSNKPIVVD